MFSEQCAQESLLKQMSFSSLGMIFEAFHFVVLVAVMVSLLRAVAHASAGILLWMRLSTK